MFSRKHTPVGHAPRIPASSIGRPRSRTRVTAAELQATRPHDSWRCPLCPLCPLCLPQSSTQVIQAPGRLHSRCLSHPCSLILAAYTTSCALLGMVACVLFADSLDSCRLSSPLFFFFFFFGDTLPRPVCCHPVQYSHNLRRRMLDPHSAGGFSPFLLSREMNRCKSSGSHVVSPSAISMRLRQRPASEMSAACLRSRPDHFSSGGR